MTTASANRALTNADGSEVQMFGNAIVTREPRAKARPRCRAWGRVISACLGERRARAFQPARDPARQRHLHRRQHGLRQPGSGPEPARRVHGIAAAGGTPLNPQMAHARHPWSSSPAPPAALAGRWPSTTTSGLATGPWWPAANLRSNHGLAQSTNKAQEAIKFMVPMSRKWTASSPPARPACSTRGRPDVVIANAGISVGMDTAERADLDVMARVFCHQQPGPGRCLPPLH